MSSFLDPVSIMLLTPIQKGAAQGCILESCMKAVANKAVGTPAMGPKPATPSNLPAESQPTRLGGSAAAAASRRQELREQLKSRGKVAESTVELVLRQELERFETAVLYVGDNNPDAIKFWLERTETYVHLATFALDILSIIPRGAAIERVFSQEGIVTSGRRARLSGASLERGFCYVVARACLSELQSLLMTRLFLLY